MMEYEAHMIALTLLNFYEKYHDQDCHLEFQKAMDSISLERSKD